MAGIVLVIIIHLSTLHFEPAFVCIEVTPEKGNMVKIYQDLQVQLSRHGIQDVRSFDTTDNSITLVIFIYNDRLLESCEALLHGMAQNADYCRIDYCMGY
ncbi:hypothetical protein HB364_13440 [Pseudoflavitalea sp. X16]|uniref:hypothetical protein n=1 Tax=Paraflavitalea devenefica TaxID=2716334 RepID=UPI0014205323|nr:hypothetical protein [Paraflavitalea devenefica]NII26092.1 hypothetical protein [Paraflavitalea devenefica]